MFLSRWRIFFFSFVCFIGVFFAVPNFLSADIKDSLPSWFPKKSVTLGLDLQGGAHLLLEVGINELVTERYSRTLATVRESLKKEKIRYKELRHTKTSVTFFLVNESDSENAKKVLMEKLAHDQIQCEISGKKASLSFSANALKEMKKQAVAQSIEVIRKRVDENGTMEPLIQAQGDDRIVLQIPGFDDPQRVRSLLGKTAKLTFRWVDGMAKGPEKDSSSGDSSVLPSYDGKENSYYRVKREVLLTGEDLIRAFTTQDERGLPAIGFELTSNGAKVFSDVTDPEKHKNQMFGIILDEKVIMAPSINSHIPNGKGIITGGQYGFEIDEANRLALLMRSGALPAPLKVIEEKVVGPGLGSDSIYLGSKATMIAIVVVSVFMLMCYSSFGIFSVVGVLFNLAFLMVCLAYIGATLTLPGIAGIALTVGMAVDANVLINERIKEELSFGRSIESSIDSGHRKAMGTIIDSNATTLIGAFILYLLGTGPVQGFAVTLAIGIVTSMFTAIELTKFFVTLWLKIKKPRALWI